MSLLIVGTVAFDKIETPLGKTDKILANYEEEAEIYTKKGAN
mgnify:CR=1 FL=1